MSNYVGNARERIILLGTAAVAAAPVRGQVPHFNLSPRSSRGLPTQGFAWTITAPSAAAAVATAPGFTVTIYRVVPTLGTWAALQPYASLNFDDQLVLPDISGGFGLYFKIGSVTTPGNVLIALAELD
jgi:hypothetical protein